MKTDLFIAFLFSVICIFSALSMAEYTHTSNISYEDYYIWVLGYDVAGLTGFLIWILVDVYKNR